MSLDRRTWLHIQDMVAYASEAMGFVEAMTFGEFEEDRKTQLAVIRCLEVIGEAA